MPAHVCMRIALGWWKNVSAPPELFHREYVHVWSRQNVLPVRVRSLRVRRHSIFMYFLHVS